MKKFIVISATLLLSFQLFSQKFNYFKFKGYEEIYSLQDTYRLNYRTEKDFFGKITCVVYDSSYIERALYFNELKLKIAKEKELTNYNVLDVKCSHLSDAIEYTDFIYSENINCNSKSSLRMAKRVAYYKSILLDEKIKYNSFRESQISQLMKLQDSIEIIKKNEVIALRKKEIELDSVEQYKKTFFRPDLISKVVGMPNATKQNLESEYQVELLAHRGGWDYYDFNKTNVGFKFGGNTNVCYKISFRMFGDDAIDYENQIRVTGFKLINRKASSNLELEADLSSQLLNGELRTYKLEGVICEVYDGSFIGFTFYRVK